MERRKFLSYMAALGASTFIPNQLYASDELAPNKNKNKNKEQKKISLNILNNKTNFDYDGKVNIKSWANRLQNKDIKYIIEKSKKVLNSRHDTVSKNKILNITLGSFQKIITANPYFIIPLATEILFDSKKMNNRIEIAATVKEGNLEKGLWYVEKENSKKNIQGMVSIPYKDDKNMLIYGKGIRWGVEGEFVSLMNYKEVDKKVDLNAYFFVNSKGTGFFSSLAAGLAPGMIARRVGDNSIRLVEMSEKLINTLKEDKHYTKNIQGNEFSYLEDLLK